jgi:hypothetical protein
VGKCCFLFEVNDLCMPAGCGARAFGGLLGMNNFRVSPRSVDKCLVVPELSTGFLASCLTLAGCSGVEAAGSYSKRMALSLPLLSSGYSR